MVIGTKSEDLAASLREHDAKVREEVLAVELTFVADSSGEAMELDGHAVTVRVTRAP